MSHLSQEAKIVLILVAIITGFFWRELFTDQTLVTFDLKNSYPWLGEADPQDLGKSSMSSDCVLSYYPRRVFATEWIRRGKLPYWNHHQFCGTPFLANFQTAVLYPINLLLYAFDPPTQMDLFIYLHVVLATVFTYLLARRLGVSIPASAVASLGFGFSETISTRYGQPTMVSSASWLPLLLLLGSNLVERPDRTRIGWLSIALFLSLLSGFPQIIIYNILGLIIYVVVVALMAKPALRRLVRLWAALAIAIGIGLLLACFQLIPSYELSTFSFRKSLPYWMIASSAHKGIVVLKYFIPDILGNPSQLGEIAKHLHEARSGVGFSPNFVSTVGYVGTIILLLAVVSIFHPCRKRLPFMVIALLTLLIVWKSPLLKFAYSFIPGFRFSRIDRAVLYYSFSMAMLAGFGLDDVLNRNTRRIYIVALCFIGFAVVLASWLTISGIDRILDRIAWSDGAQIRSVRNYQLGKVTIFVILSLLSTALVVGRRLGKVSKVAFISLCLLLVLIDLLPRAAKFKVTQPSHEIIPKSRFVEELVSDGSEWRIAKFRADVLPANIASVVGIDDIHGYDALNLGHYIEFLGAIDSSIVAVENAMLRRRIGPISQSAALESPLLDFLNVRYFLGVASIAGGRPKAIRWANNGYLPRAFLVERPVFFETYDAVMSYIKSGRFDPAHEVLLVGEQSAFKAPGGLPLQGSAEIIYSDPGRMEFEVDASKECYLVVSEAWYPCWKAYIDGKPVPLLRANYAFQAVVLPSGKHRLEFLFKPGSLKIGILFSLAGLVLVVSMFIEARGSSSDRSESSD